MNRTAPLALTLALALAPLAARAQEPPPPPRIVHLPPGVAEAQRPLVLRFRFLHGERIARTTVAWRLRGETAWRTIACARDESAWRADLPAAPAAARALEYHVDAVTVTGETRHAFATPERPHVVVLRLDEDDEQELRDLAARRGLRLEFMAGGEFTDFGARANPEGRTCGAAAGDCRDWWYSLYGQVRYRFHRRVRSVAVRVERLAGVTTRQEANGPVSREVGLVSASAEVELRLVPWMTLAVTGILGANEQSVQGGGGARLELGTTYPARVQLSFQGITNYGLLGAAWLRWDTAPHTPLGAGVEITTQPGANADPGVRLLVEVGREFGRHLTVTARGGYGSRREDAAGFTVGGNVQLAF
jgi:hypothetical protein